MQKVTFTGKNTSVSKYGYRFEPNKPILVADEIAEKLAQEQDFTVEENQAESVPSGDVSKDDDNGKDDGPTLQELKDQAKAAGIKGYSTMNKPDLIHALADLPQKDDPYANAPTA
ncbi:Rho termination factor N-terminal domain-containing protein [Paenibacillus barcinonensis]|uniref:Rho termination factor N-terminal domain-containing protein n=1 Tax=Paenibacillus barcinonensis TaxID=198119 RepID=UPI001C0FCE75|nr:Rho termination factor N-terminal domain-containing protein [Paenibacillus barcinonensis]MBU5356138.1 Rho termination factor N-terminal domain-containing protein [Paenibacillus barcinonensis]